MALRIKISIVVSIAISIAVSIAVSIVEFNYKLHKLYFYYQNTII